MKIGLVGEAPQDTMAIKNLLQKRYIDFTFIELLKNKLTGALLENQKTKTELRIECSTHKPDIVVFIRDLDGLATKEFREQQLRRQEYYNNFKGCTHVKKTIFLLNIWEIEALIFSDINAFNLYYSSSVDYNGNPMEIPNPKEELYKLNRKYSESHNSKILEKANFETIYKNCNYFKEFVNEFDKLVK